MFKYFFFFRYLSFNKQKLKLNLHKNAVKDIILCEISDMHLFSISNSLFLKSLSDINNAKIYSYYINFKLSNSIKNFFKLFLNPFSVYNIYKSFSTKVFFANIYKFDLKKKFFKKIKDNSELENLKFKNLKIGDCIYDDYLSRFKLPSIDVKSKHFQKNLKIYEKFILYWDSFFLNNKVNSLVVSHSVYLSGLLARIALCHNCNVYVISPSSHYKLTKKKYIKWCDHYYYPKIFKKINIKERKRLVNLAKINLSNRFKGKIDARYKYSNYIKPVFKNNKIIKNKNNTKNINILISSHCLSDAPHVYGKMLFNDFSKWLNFLRKFSNKRQCNNYRWYLKPHPAYYDQDIKFYQNLSHKFKNFKILSKHISHNEIIKKLDIHIALTVFGSIAYEYPFFGIPVINAGVNPHMGYNFSVTPNNVAEYKRILTNIKYLIKSKSYDLNKKNQIYEFYCLHHLLDYDLLSYLNINTRSISDYFGIKNYEFFLKNITNQKYLNIKKKYNNFIKNNSRRLLINNINDNIY